MGSRGRTALAGLFLGSVTNGVLARTKNPLLILRNKPAPEADAMRVGICVDGSKFGTAAVKYALRPRFPNLKSLNCRRRNLTKALNPCVRF